jgi:predicted RNase H-like nuclease (RuvC/YqgF family)
LEAADAAKADDDRMDEFARVINGAKDDFATVLHDIGELREKFAQVNARFQKFTGTADENFSTLHGLVEDYRTRLNKVTSKLHILQQSHNWLSDRVLVLENDTVRKLTDRVKGMEELQEEQASRDVDTRLQALEDRLNDQAEEIAILRGKVCRCKKPVEVVDVATVFEGIEDLYADAPQGTRRTSSSM